MKGKYILYKNIIPEQKGWIRCRYLPSQQKWFGSPQRTKMTCGRFGVQVKDYTTLVLSKTKENHLKKIDSKIGTWLPSCGPYYRKGNSFIFLMTWLQLHLAFWCVTSTIHQGTQEESHPNIQWVIDIDTLVLAMDPEVEHELTPAPDCWFTNWPL